VFFFPSPSSHFFIFQFVAFFVIFKLLNTIFAAIWHSKTDSEKMLSKLQDAHIYFSGVKLDLILFFAPHQHIPQSAHQDNLGEPRRARRAGRAVRGSLFAHTLTAHFVRYKGTLRAATISLAARFASFLPQS
jgi:hypothetical protein